MSPKAARRSLLAGFLFAAAGPASGQVASPWLPEPGTVNVTLTYVREGFQDFRAGARERRLRSPMMQNTGVAIIEYGLHKKLAFDVTSGYTRATAQGINSSGSADTVLGLRYGLYQGERVTFTLRAAGIIAGSYPLIGSFPIPAGLKLSGFHGSTITGVNLGRGFYASAQTGYTLYESPGAHQIVGNAILGHSFRRFSYYSGYQETRAVSGLDMGTAGFNRSKQPQIKRIYGGLDAGIGYTTPGGIYIGFNYGHFLHGRNVGKKSAYAVTLGFRIPKRFPHF